MAELPLVFAFTAGLLATINPCGFAMLPAYLSFLLGVDDATDQPSMLVALRVGALVAVGFLAVFGVAGSVVAAGVGWLVPSIPWLALVVGVAVAAAGVWLLTGRTLPAPVRVARSGPTGAGHLSSLGFGVSYGLASLSCTLPVFLTVTAAAVARPDLASRAVVLGAYGAGMVVLLLAVTVALAAGREQAVRRLRRWTPVLQRGAGALLVAAGLYVIGYWAVVLRGGDPLAAGRFGEQAAAVVANLFAGRGLLVGAIAVSVVLVGVVATVQAVRRGRERDADRVA